MATIIEIPYKPRIWAQKLHNSFKRYFSLIIHRRGGKTTGLVNHFQKVALDDKWERERMKFLVPGISDKDLKAVTQNRRYGIIFPTYTQAKTVAWDMMKFYASPVPNVKFNESELTVAYPNGSKCRLFGSDKPDALRGPAFWGLGFDEYSQQPSNIFSEVLSKGLADHLGFAIFAGTIVGKNQLYQTHDVAKKNPNQWDYVWQDIDESFEVEQGITIELLKQGLEDDRRLVEQGIITQEEFDQEWYLSTSAAIKGAYYSQELKKALKDNRIKEVPHDPALLVHTVWDLGKGANMAVGFYQKSFNQIRKIDYLEGGGDDGLPQVIKKVQEKPYIFGKHFAPHDIRAVDIGTGKTRIETAKELNLKFEVVPQLPVQDGIDAGKRVFNRLWIDKKKCELWKDTIALYHKEWDEKRGMFKDNPYHDWTSHAADEHRYMALIEDQMLNEASKTGLERGKQKKTML